MRTSRKFRDTKLWSFAGVILFTLIFLGMAPVPVILAAGEPGTGPGGVGATNGSSGLRLWLKSGEGLYTDISCATPAATGEQLACWADQSGSGNDVVQADPAYQPRYLSAKAVEFDTDVLSTTHDVQLFATASSGLSAIVVFDTGVYTTNSVILNYGASAGTTTNKNLELGYTFAANGDFGLHRGGNNATLASTAGIRNDRFAILSARVFPTGTTALNSMSVYSNGAKLSLSVSGTGWLVAGNYPTNAVPLNIGARCDGNQGGCDLVAPDAFHQGRIAEIIVFTQTLNSAQHTIIANYLASKYGIALAPGVSKYANIYTLGVIGIGKEADGIHQESRAAGLILSNGTFLKDNGDYIMVGHDVKENLLTSASLPPGVDWRWTRMWYYKKTDVGSNGGSVTMKFDFSDAGIDETPHGLYVLLGRPGPIGKFRVVQTSSYIVGDQVIFTDTAALKLNWFYTLGKVSNLEYFAEDSKYSPRIAYNFEDISGTGIPVTFTTNFNEMSGAVPLNFIFNFYDRNYTDVYVATNGFLTFLDLQSPGVGVPVEIPTADVHDGIIAGLWNAYDLRSTGNVYYQTIGSAPNRRFILQYNNIPIYGSPTVTSTFQIKLFESSNIIEVHYLDANPKEADYNMIGIENHAGDKGVQYSYADVEFAGMAVRYSRPSLLLETAVNDLTPRVGSRITYTLVVRSNLTTTTSAAALVETLDSGLLFVPNAVTVSPARSFTSNYQGQSLTLSNFNLAAGEWLTFTVPVMVGSSVEIGTQLFSAITLSHAALSAPQVNVENVLPDNCWVKVNNAAVIYDAVQKGVDAAAPGDVVKIAGHCLNVDTFAGTQQLAYISKTLTLRGGFTPSNWTTPNPSLETTLNAQGQGRVVFAVSGIALNLENLHLIHGDATQGGGVSLGGGGIYITSSVLTLNNVQVYENMAEQGGGIYAYTGTLTINDGAVSNNVATNNGGGIYLLDQQTTLSGISLIDNTLDASIGQGAGIYALRGTLVLTDGVSLASNVGTQYGGGAYLENCHATFYDTAVISNTAGRGAGMNVIQSQLTIGDARFEHNDSWARSGYGGGIYLFNSPTTIVASSFISNVASNSSGGAIAVDNAAVTLRNSMVISNVSLTYGGGIYATNSASVTLRNNEVSDNRSVYGAGLYFNVGRLTAAENVFASNHVAGKGYGGGLCLYNTVSSVISDNVFVANSSYHAGGIFITDDSTAVIAHNQIISNMATINGGGSYARRGAVNIYGNEITSNIANGNGAGVFLSSGAPKLYLNAILSNTATTDGGGAYVATAGSVITQNTFSANHAGGYGGGVRVASDDDAVIGDNRIVYNVATSQGGGLYMSGSDLTCTGNTIEYNHASANSSEAGGIFVSGGAPVVEYNTIRYNTTAGRGGGGYVTGVNAAVFRHNTFASNSASNTSNSGGGLYVAGSVAQFDSNQVISNTAMGSGGGVYMDNATNITFFRNTFANNSATLSGGAMYIYRGTYQLIENTVRNNFAGYASDSGAGLYLRNSGSAAVNRNLIADNVAQGQGGGIYLNACSAMVLDGNRILRNTAQVGGAGVRLILSHARFLNNVVADNVLGSGNGSGIYSEQSNASFLHTTVARNTGGSNMGIYHALPSIGVYTLQFTDTILISHTIGISVAKNSTAIMNATLWGNTIDWGGSGSIVRIAPNVYGNPDFVNPNAGDYRIGINSSATDAGIDSGVLWDMEGEPRPVGDRYDLGADEYGGRCHARLNNNSTLYMSVQDAVNASSSPNDVIKVAGVCAGVQSIGGVTQTVYLNKSLTIQGGYTLTHWTSSNPTLYPTTLDAQGKGRVLYVTGGVSVTVKDINITGGEAALGGGADSGGGVYVNNATLTLQHAEVFSNTAANGGGVYLYQGNSSKLFLNTIRDNVATSGGGVYWNQSTAQAEANQVFLNTADRGGGFYLSSSSARLANNVIVDNTATNQGSGVYIQGAAPTLLHLTVARNTGGEGSGLHLAGSSTARITNTVMVDHNVGVVVESGSSALLNATYWGNGAWANGVNWSGSGTVTHQNDYSSGDPAFVAPDDQDYHIGETSALLNVGVATDVVADMDGFARDRSPDLGADEYRTCWARLNNTSTDYPSVQEAVDASTQATDIVKVAGYCSSVFTRPRNDTVTTGVVSQVAYLNKTLTIQGGYTATNFTTPYPALQPTTLDPLGAGRAVYVTGNVHPTLIGLHLTGGNAAGLGGYATGNAGGGLYVATGSVTVDGCQIYLNTADVGSGAHVYLGSLLLRNTLVADNHSLQPGGAVHAWDATLRGIHTTLAQNADTGIYLENTSAAFMTNTILISHSLGIDVANSSASFLATLWGNNTDWDTGNANIQTSADHWGNPAFVDPSALDYHIRFGSAAIDRGVDAGVTLDGDFESRPTGAGYDLGADEFPEAFIVTKRATPPLALSGENITYTISITNTGHTYLELTVMDRMPDHMIPTGDLFWSVDLEPGEVWLQQLMGNVELGYLGFLTNTVMVTSTTGITAQDTCLAEVSTNANLGILKTASASTISSGERLTYTLSYVNDGPSPTTGVRITDVVPTALQNVQIASSRFITPVGGINYAWDIGNLPMGSGGIITISGVVANGLVSGTVIANSASIAGMIVDGDPYNNYTGPVNVMVVVPNVPPVAMDDTTTVAEATPTVLNVLSNDTDANGDTLHLVSVSAPAHGQATLNTTTTILYTPTLNYNGPDTFTYVVSDGAATDSATVNLTVLAVNDPPVAVGDAYSTTRNAPLSVPAPGVLGNDSDPEGSTLAAFKETNPASGSLIFLTTGAFTYTPAFNFVGVVSFTYRVFDGGATSPVATVVITVAFDNDAPVAQNDYYYALFDTPRTIAAPGVLKNDTDANSDTLTAILDAAPAEGSVSLVSNGAFVFTPTTGFEGVTSFTYHADDTWDVSNVATVYITVTAGNVPPTAEDDDYVVSEDTALVIAPLQGVLANDEDLNGDPLIATVQLSPTHGVLTLRPDGSLLYTPTLNFNGADSFTYYAYDGVDLSNAATAHITVLPVNDPPVFTSLPVETAVMDQLYTYTITTSDPDGDTLTMTAITLPGWLTLTTGTPATLSGTPSASDVGDHAVVLEVSDGIDDPVRQSFTITVSETGENNNVYLPLVMRQI